MDKHPIISALIVDIETQLVHAQASMRDAQVGATHPDAKAENQYDTRALELTYLAAGLGARVAELRAALAFFHFYAPLDLRDEPVTIGSLIELHDDRGSAWYFLAPAGYGTALSVDGIRVQVITAASPLGRALMEKSVDDEVTLPPPQKRKYLILQTY